MLAVINGHTETVEILLNHDNADLSIVDLYERSVIYCAAEENAIEVLEVINKEKLFLRVSSKSESFSCSYSKKTKELCRLLNQIILNFLSAFITLN